MKFNALRYFSTLFTFAIAVLAAWWMWNYYMQSPWTRDGKVHAEMVKVASEVEGRLIELPVTDNQFVHKGDLLLSLDPRPYQIALENAQAQLAKSEADSRKAEHESTRRAQLSTNIISAEDQDSYRQSASAMKASMLAAKANVDQAEWNLSQTKIVAPVDGWVTNFHLRKGDYINTGSALFALVDSHSFYVVGYFEETKLRHIRPGLPATLTLYSDNAALKGRVESIGRAISDQSVDSDSSLVPDVKPTVPWVRLAQRVPVRIALTNLPQQQLLVAGTTCTIVIHPESH
ncbi:HlyD family secretion protein [Rosenbergiella epipactidis]|uniref:efflux RND transporter periplasmic adaptor subunit n=1 Tax=Rosenbergiella epipactidis TaxID=1544694 RepID=UPI001BD99FFC|nr:HlyD family secretion protein [Rosenbergiella epipactidis]MBT0716916.1 HlyD family secretion protein [Rosenbergiella epipactidis]